MRTKQIDIAGGTYWIAYSEGVKLMMRDTYGVDCEDEAQFAEAMKHFDKRTGHDVQNPPTYEEFSALVDSYDLIRVFPDLKEVMQGDRNVIAKPAKKAKAGA